MERTRLFNIAARAGASLGVAFLLQLSENQKMIRADEGEPQIFYQGKSEKNAVALTFDCGPWVDGKFINPILDALEQRHLRLTFFVSGQFIEKYPDVFDRIAASHHVAEHSYTHLKEFTRIGEDEQRQEHRWTEEAANARGVSLKPWWRPPFGAYNSQVVWTAAEEGFPLAVMWTIDSADWTQVSSETVKNRILRAQKGDIVVEHCNSPQSAEIIGEVLDGFKDREIKVVSIPELVE